MATVTDTETAGASASSFGVAWREAELSPAGLPPRLGVLFTYANSEAANRRVLAEATDRKLPVILDSGAWSVFNAGAKIDREAHAAFVIAAQDDFPDARFLALDVIDSEVESFRNWVAQREAGARVEPTIHFGSPPSDMRLYLDRAFGGGHPGLAPMADGRSWINVGGLVSGQSNPAMHRRMAAWSAAVRREVDKYDPAVRIHGLGTTTPAVNDLVRFDGVDSSYWLVSLARFRTLPLFNPDTRRWTRMLIASAKPAYERESRSALYAAARMLRKHYGASPADLWEMTDDERLGLSLRSHAYFADAYRTRHRRLESPIVYLAGAPTKHDDPIWEEIARWSHGGPLA